MGCVMQILFFAVLLYPLVLQDHAFQHFLIENRILLKPVLEGVSSVAHTITVDEQTQ